MSDTRTPAEIEQRARHLYAIHSDISGPVQNQLWEGLPDGQKDGWRRLAKSIPGVIHNEESTSGGWPTSPQADTIRLLREDYENREGFSEQSYIGTTRPYGEMVVIFSWTRDNPAIKGPISRGYLIHPDGHYEDLHKERVPDSYMKEE